MSIFGPNIKKLEKQRNVEGLLEVMQHKNPKTREKAAFALERLGWEPGDDTEKAIYLIARRDWGGLKMIGVNSVQPLLQVLDDAISDYKIRVDANLAHGSKNIKDVSREECDLLEDVLASIGTPAIDPLIRAVKEKRETEIWQDWFYFEVTKTLEKMGEQAVGPLIGLLNDDTRKVIQIAAQALGGIGDVRAIEPLDQLLNDETKHWSTRTKAIDALEKINDGRALEILVGALKDQNLDIRTSSASSLSRLDWNPKDEVEKAYYIFALMISKGRYQRGLPKMEWDELIRLGSYAVGPMVQSLPVEDKVDLGTTKIGMGLKFDNISSAGYIALNVLIKLGKPAVGPLIQALKAIDKETRKKAAIALGEIRDAGAAGPLTQALEDVDQEVQIAAKKALKNLR